MGFYINRKGKNNMPINDKHKIVNNLDYYNKTAVPPDGSCFYHSLAIGLRKNNIINESFDINHKYLRQICINYFQENKSNPWLLNKIKYELRNQYQFKHPDKNIANDKKFKQEVDNASSIDNINKYINDYITKGVDNTEWGRPDIEGQIICNFFKKNKINIHLVTPNKIDGLLEYSHTLYFQDNEEYNLIIPEDFEKYYKILTSHNTICIIHNGGNHFEYADFLPPILQTNEDYTSGNNINDNSIDEKEYDMLDDFVSIDEKEYDILNDSVSIDEKEYDMLDDFVSIDEKEYDMLDDFVSIDEKEYDMLDDAKEDKLVIFSNDNNINSNSILKLKTSNPIKERKNKDIDEIQINPIVNRKIKDCVWNIKKNKKINKEIILEKEENDFLKNLIKQYKSNIFLIFDKNTKNFKEAFVVDNQGNKKSIKINEVEKIKSLEKIFVKILEVLKLTTLNFDTENVNNFEKHQTCSKLNNKGNNKHPFMWKKYVTKM